MFRAIHVIQDGPGNAAVVKLGGPASTLPSREALDEVRSLCLSQPTGS